MRFIILVFLCFAQTINAAEITAKTDRAIVHANESFKLIFEATGSVDDDPDFTPLEKDFDILNRSQSSNISIINGDYKKSIKWTLALMAKQSGVITIPSIAFGTDQSPQLRLTVKSAGAPGTGKNDNLIIEVESSHQQAYVQAQLIITVKMLSGENIARYGFQAFDHEGVEAIIEQLGEDKQYQAYKGNKPYLVLERKYAVFPQQAGQLRILPFKGEVEVINRSSNFYDPFNRNTKTRRVRSKALDIDVRGIPTEFKGSTWLPATEIQLVEEWPKQQTAFKAGEPVTRTLSLLADGLTSAQLPEMPMTSVAGLKQYPDQPVLHDNKKIDGIIGIREEKMALIPTAPGRYTLPAIEIPWWNINTHKMETARIAAKTIEVMASDNTPGSPPASNTPNRVETPEPAVPAPTPLPVTEEVQSTDRFWLIVSAMLATGWVATLLAWWLIRRGQRESAEPSRSQTNAVLSMRQAHQQLQHACASHDPHQCKQALLVWGQALFPDQLISNLGQLAQHAGEPLATEITKLDTLLYSQHSTSWDASALLAACEQISDSMKQQLVHSSAEPLEPLYK